MFTVEGVAFKDLMEARQYLWDLPYYEMITIYSYGQPAERWKGRRRYELLWDLKHDEPRTHDMETRWPSIRIPSSHL